MFKFLIFSSPMIIALFFWIKDGAQLSFWATSIELREEIPVVPGMPELGTQTKVTWIDNFVCGIETPVTGLIASSFIFLLSNLYKKKFEKSFELNGN